MIGQIITPSQQVPAAPASSPTSVLNALLAPARLHRQLRPWLQWASGGTTGAWLSPLDPRQAKQHAEKARQWLATMPSRGELMEADAKFFEAATEHATPAQAEMVAAVMMDAYPLGRTNPAIYAEMLAICLADQTARGDLPSATVMAVTARNLISKSKFVPAVSEFLDHAKRVRNAFWGGHVHAEHLLELRFSAEDVLHELGEWSPEYDGFDDTIPDEAGGAR